MRTTAGYMSSYFSRSSPHQIVKPEHNQPEVAKNYNRYWNITKKHYS
jgi:hypothetical protein